jgi:hypothetical protein
VLHDDRGEGDALKEKGKCGLGSPRTFALHHIMSSQNRSQSQVGICCPTLMVTDVEELHEIEKLRGAQMARDSIRATP